jgi:adenylate cyclase
MRACQDGHSDDPERDGRKAITLARRALQAAADDAGTLANTALVLSYFGEDIGAVMSLADRALALNPSFARGWHVSGVIRLRAGQPDAAIEYIENSLRLSPRARSGWPSLVVGSAHFQSRRFDRALPKLLEAIQEDPSFPDAYRTLAACYAHMGRLDEARAVVERLRAITPVVMPLSVAYLRNPDHRELLLSGLRVAAGETT